MKNFAMHLGVRSKIGVLYSNNYIMESTEGNVITRYILNLSNNEEKEYMRGWLNESQYNRLIYNHIARSLNVSNL
jgi:hypothetical protein